MDKEKEARAEESEPKNEIFAVVGVIASFAACALALFHALIYSTSASHLFAATALIMFAASLMLFIGKVANDLFKSRLARTVLLLLGFLGTASLLLSNGNENPTMFCFGCFGIPLMVLSYSDEATELKHKVLPLACFSGFAIIALTIALASLLPNEAIDVIAAFVLVSVAAICKGIKLRRQNGSYRFVSAGQSEQNDTSRPKRLSGQIEWGITIGTCFALFLLEARPLMLSSVASEKLIVPFTFLVAGVVVITLFFCFHTRYEKYINNFFASGFVLLTILFLAIDATQRGFFAVALLFYILILATSFLDGIISENRFLDLSPFWQFGKDLSAFFLASALSVCLIGILWFFNLQILCVAILCTIVCALQSQFETRPYPDETIDDSNGVDIADSSQNEDAIDLILANFSLTQRQKEVFTMLSKGRNAAYISEYYCISYSTAKTHIHNLYSKLGVHSQQEMITLIEHIDHLSPTERLQFCASKDN